MATSGVGDRKPRSLLNLPPGYHFAPTDDELVVHYLRPKIDGLPPLLPIFRDEDVVSCHPEKITSEEFKDPGVDRWYFFTQRRRKYNKGSRPNRTTTDKAGMWKATGPQRMIFAGKKKDKIRPVVGRVRTLVFYNAPKQPNGTAGKTSWTMYEYENLASEADAAEPNVDKINEWVLCTIQKKEEGSHAGEKKVKEKGKVKIKEGSKKRKGKQEKMEAEKGTDEDPIQALHLMKRSKAPMQLTHPETFAPEEGDDIGMFDSEYPRKSSPMPTAQQQQQQHESPSSEIMPTVQQHESPSSETMPAPCIAYNNYYSPSMAPTPCLQESPHSETTTTTTPVGGSYYYYNNGSAGPDMTSWMPWHGSPFWEMMPRACEAGNTYGFGRIPSTVPTPLPQEVPHMKMVDAPSSSSFSGYSSYDNIDPSSMPATSYPYPPLAFVYGGAA